MNVPLLDLKAQLAPLRDEIVEAIIEVVDSGRYIMGPKVEEIESHVAQYSGTRHGIGVSSGTDALLVSLMALGIGPGDKVLTTPYTFFATMGSILRLGAKPVFVDIDPVTYNIDPGPMEEALAKDAQTTGEIKAIMPVHLYGQCADMTKILALAERFNLPVIEDAAQAIGTECPMKEEEGFCLRRAGSMGNAGCFSFFPSKNLGAIGDGGMIVVNDDKLAEKIRILRDHGASPKYHHAFIGGNFRLDALQAAVLKVKLPHLPEWHKARRRNASLYSRLFEDSGLTDSGTIQTPSAVYKFAYPDYEDSDDIHIFNQYVIRVPDRDGLKAFLHEKGVATEIYYPLPLHMQKCLAGMGYNELSFPEAEKAAKETLALPIYPELTDTMLHFVVEQIHAFYTQ